MLQVIKIKLTFPIRKGFLHSEMETKTFTQKIPTGSNNFTIGVTGFELKIVTEEGHKRDRGFHLAKIDIQGKKIDDYSIEITGELGIRDASGEWDDHYTGFISFAIIALTEEFEESTEVRSGFVHSIKAINSEVSSGLLVGLYIPIDEEIVELKFDLSEHDSSKLILASLLRDALALSLPVTCDVIVTTNQEEEQYTLVNAQIKTRKFYHQAGWEISDGQIQPTEDKQFGTVKGNVTKVEIKALGLLKGTNDDLPDVARIVLRDVEGQRTELFLELQRVNQYTYLSMLTMLLESYKGGQEIEIGYYVEPFFYGDETRVKMIQSVNFS